MDDQKTMTPEEVKRDVETVRDGLQPRPKVPARLDFREAALSRLAAQAARVPGLEVDLKGAQDALASALLRETDLERQRDDLHRENVANERAATTATAERDAAQRDAATANEHLQTIHAQVAEVAQLLDAEAVHDGWGLHAAAQRILADRAALRERVATLERSLSISNDERANEQDGRLSAEARVRELEGLLAGARGAALEEAAKVADCKCRPPDPGFEAAHGRKWHSMHCTVQVAESIRALASHPAPATGAASVDALRMRQRAAQHLRNVASTHPIGGSIRGVLEVMAREVEALESEPIGSAPTPPPGLLDLLGEFLTAVAATPRNPYPTEDDPRAAGWADALDAMREGANALTGALNAARASRVPELPGLLEAVLGALAELGFDLKPKEEERIRAAYDAAKGGEPPDSVAARANFNDLRRALEMATLGSHVGDTETAMGEKTVQAVRALHEDAAKYRAAVERLNNHAGKAKAAHDAWGSDPEGAVVRWVLFGDGEAPRETLDKAQVVEVLRDSRDRHLKAAQEHVGTSLEMDHRAMADACTQVATRLGLTLDTPPSGSVDKPLHTWGVRGGRFSTDDEGPRPDPDDHWCKGECGELTFTRPGEHEAWHDAHARATATPPAGPGGGEDWPLPPHDRCEMTCLVGRPSECCGPEMAGIRDATRARIAPERTQDEIDADASAWIAEQPRASAPRRKMTPTQEVPPLKAEPAAPEKRGCLAGDHVWWDDGESCACRATRRPVKAASQSQPSVPGVVWEGAGLKVKADGSVWDTHEHRAPWQVTEILARALAETKREAAQAACQAIRRFASRLGDDATGLDTDRSLEELEVALYQHVMDEEDKARAHAAETMRERAAKECDETANDAEVPAHTREVARLLAKCIRALPLE